MACRKMRLVLDHFLRCGGACPTCRQLVCLVAKHAVHLCDAPAGGGCRVPMCDGLKIKMGMAKEHQHGDDSSSK